MKGEPIMQQLRVSVKRKAGDNLTSRPSKLIRSELHKLDGHLLHSEDIRSNGVQLVNKFGTKSKSSINKNFLCGIGKKLQIRRTRKNNQA
jgi:hypothetical protein